MLLRRKHSTNMQNKFAKLKKTQHKQERKKKMNGKNGNTFRLKAWMKVYSCQLWEIAH